MAANYAQSVDCEKETIRIGTLVKGESDLDK
jgi:hypothetical protein